MGRIRGLRGHTTSKWESPDLNQPSGAQTACTWPVLVYVRTGAVGGGGRFGRKQVDDTPTLTELKLVGKTRDVKENQQK